MPARVSVILNSYVHRQYVADALASVATQDSSAPIDVVILTPDASFEVPEPVRRSAAERGHVFRVVRIPAGPAGVGLRIGATTARGDLLAVLDDDDLFEPGKIRWIETVAEEVEKVGYLHNAQSFVDARNRSLSPLNPHRLVRHPASLWPEGRSLTVDPHDPALIARGMSLAESLTSATIL